MVLKNLQGECKHTLLKQYCVEGIPKIYWYGEEAGSNILVMELLDSNIEELL